MSNIDFLKHCTLISIWSILWVTLLFQWIISSKTSPLCDLNLIHNVNEYKNWNNLRNLALWARIGTLRINMWIICIFSNSLYMLVRMGDHVINAEDTGSFLTKTFAFCLVNIKSKFDNYVVSQLSLCIETCKIWLHGITV